MVNYSQLIGRAMVLMQKPSVVDSPSDRVPAKAPRWVFVDTEGYGSRNCVSWCPWMFSGYVGIYIGGRSTSVAARGAHETGGTPYRGGAAPYLVGPSEAS